ncbi:MAG TPA: pyridoxal phosphate-dependent aminotransferase [Thermoleophilaceae bacterium]|nr:pyridoxal phosphate-dependent aminotransferase [Thermoleophilaceae bacterium]
MKLAVFRQEEFFEEYEFSCELMLALSGAEPMTAAELERLAGGRPDLGSEVGYTPSSGYPELRDAIAALNPPAERDNVMVTVGAIEALLILHNLLLDPGDEVVCLWPAYQPLYELARGAGANVRFVELAAGDDFAIDLGAIEDSVGPRTKAVLLNVPHNPTGQTVPPEDLRELARRLAPLGVHLIVDEVFREMRSGHPPSAWDGQDNLIVIGSMSKSYALPGLRVGWLVANPELVVKARQFRKYTSLNPGSRDQLWALAALERRDAILERTWALTEGGAELATRWLANHPEDFELSAPPAGGLFFPRLLHDVPTLDFCAELVHDTGVLLAPGSVCYESEGFLRLGVATPQLAAGLDRLDGWLERTRSKLGRGAPA